MKMKWLLFMVVVLFAAAFAFPVYSQVATKTGSIYGKAVDDKGAPLPGVTITLESNEIPTQTATSGPSGGFRFANLPPGVYSVNFSIEGFTEVRQEEVRVSTGSQVQLEITMKPSLAEEFTVIGETPVVDTKKTGTSDTFSREYLEEVPSARDPWTIIDQTTGVDMDRYNVAGSESGQQAVFIARGGTDDNTVYNYDGVNATDPGAMGASPTYFDFDAFEELQISTGGNDASAPNGGVVVNIVTKRAGNKWEGNASYFYSGDSLQGDNTPDELAAIGAKSNRLDEVKDYGFDVGGPIIKDKLFAWGAYRKNEIGLITTANTADLTELEDFNFKANMNWNTSNESQFGYFKGEKTKSGRAAISIAIQAPETLWDQGGTDTITPGIWTGQHTFIPNDHTIVTGRYGYIGLGFTLVPKGGKDIPMVYLASIPRWEDTIFYVKPIDRPAHDFVVDANYFKENVIGGDHEFKFGFEYKTAKLHTFSSYGNGVFVVDYNQTVPQGPFTSGIVYAQHYLDGRAKLDRASFYVTDTFRKNRLTLNLGLRFDHQTGENLASSIPGIPGFESIVGPLEFPGNDPGITFNDLSPRIGATYDVTGDGKTIIRGNFAKYYDALNNAFITYLNPTFVYNGAILSYTNLDGDRVVDPNEITSAPGYYGGLNGPIFDLNAFQDSRKIDSDLKNGSAYEYIVGFERQLMQDLSVGATYTHRDYRDTISIVSNGVSAADFVPGGVFTANTVLGSFNVPFFVYGGVDDGDQLLTNANDYKTKYDGVDITVRKRMSNNFLVNGGLTLQKQKANYDGGDSLAFYIADGGLNGQVFPFDPTNLPFLNDQAYAFAPGGSGKSGVYPYSEWQLKLSGVYQFPWDISAGAYARYQQGYPYVLFATIREDSLAPSLGTTNHLILVEPFGSRRFENIFTLDLQFEKGIDFGNYGRLAVSANLFNVTNTNTVIRRLRSVTSSQLNRIDELISPRALRLGVRYSF
ncbi:TonB-dependent receptor [bacterium]|nr:TonB-dependent receptor [bacterium]